MGSGQSRSKDVSPPSVEPDPSTVKGKVDPPSTPTPEETKEGLKRRTSVEVKVQPSNTAEELPAKSTHSNEDVMEKKREAVARELARIRNMQEGKDSSASLPQVAPEGCEEGRNSGNLLPISEGALIPDHLAVADRESHEKICMKELEKLRQYQEHDMKMCDDRLAEKIERRKTQLSAAIDPARQRANMPSTAPAAGKRPRRNEDHPLYSRSDTNTRIDQMIEVLEHKTQVDALHALEQEDKECHKKKFEEKMQKRRATLSGNTIAKR